MPLKGYKAHKVLHQDAGSDELSVTGLSGVLADDQHIIDAEAVSAMGAKADANPLNHDRYTDALAVTAAKTVKLDAFTAPDDGTTLDASNARHGLLKKLIDDTTKFLRSDGGWQVPAGGGATKEFFAHADWTAAKAVLQNYLLPSTLTLVTAYIDFYIPNDFTSIVSAVVVVLYNNTEAAANIDLYSDYAAKDETYNTHAESSTVPTYAITANKWTEISIAGILSSLAAGDYVGIKIIAAITQYKQIWVLGVRFRYS